MPPWKYSTLCKHLLMHFHISSWWGGDHPQKWELLPSTIVLSQYRIHNLYYFIQEKWKKKSMISSKISNCQSLTKRLKWNKSFILKANLYCLRNELRQPKDVSWVPTSSFAQGWGPIYTASPVYTSPAEAAWSCHSFLQQAKKKKNHQTQPNPRNEESSHWQMTLFILKHC